MSVAGVERSQLRVAARTVAHGACLDSVQTLVEEPPGQGGRPNCAQNVAGQKRGSSWPRFGGRLLPSIGGDRPQPADMEALH
jgi:hypothetical protein